MFNLRLFSVDTGHKLNVHIYLLCLTGFCKSTPKVSKINSIGFDAFLGSEIYFQDIRFSFERIFLEVTESRRKRTPKKYI